MKVYNFYKSCHVTPKNDIMNSCIPNFPIHCLKCPIFHSRCRSVTLTVVVRCYVLLYYSWRRSPRLLNILRGSVSFQLMMSHILDMKTVSV